MQKEDLQNEVKLESKEDIIAHNLEMLNTKMLREASEESMGGNAGKELYKGKECPCIVVNGYIREIDGKIIALGNPQYMPEGLLRTTTPISFRLVVDITTSSYRILGTHIPDNCRDMVSAAVDEFNRRRDAD